MTPLEAGHHGGDCDKLVRTPGVCGGSACIRNTRIAVWLLESWRRLGWNDESIRSTYDLQEESLKAAWAYVAANRDEIDREIAENNVP